jgi:hypothetical protein
VAVSVVPLSKATYRNPRAGTESGLLVPAPEQAATRKADSMAALRGLASMEAP